MTVTRLNPVTHVETATTLADLGIWIDPSSGFTINTSDVFKYGDVFMCNVNIKNGSAISAFVTTKVCYMSGLKIGIITGVNYMGQVNSNGNCWITYMNSRLANTTLDGRMIGFL